MADLPAGFVLLNKIENMQNASQDLQGQQPQQAPQTAMPNAAPASSNLPAGFQLGASPIQQQAPAEDPLHMPEPKEFDAETASIGEVLQEAGRNLPSSILQLGKDMIAPWTDIEGSAKGLYNVVAGAFQKAIPGRQGKEQYAELVADYYLNRYTTVKGFKEALAKDPAGVLSDAASIIIPGGQAIRGLGTAAKIKGLTKLSQTLEKTGKGLSRLGVGLDPLGAASEVTGQVLGKTGLLLDKFSGTERAVEAYRKAVNFSHTIPVKAQRKFAKLAMNENIVPSMRALDKVRSEINLLATQVNDLIDAGQRTGKSIPVTRFFREFRKLEKEAHLIHPDKPGEGVAILKEVRKDMYEYNRDRMGGRRYTTEEIQNVKQNIYKNLESYYEKVKSEPMRVKAKLAIARAARESLEDFFPEIKQLNKREGQLIELYDALYSPANRLDKQKFLNVSNTLKAMGGGALAGPAGVGAAMVSAMYSQPKVKAKLAIIGNNLRKQGIQLSPMWTELRILSSVSERKDREQQED